MLNVKHFFILQAFSDLIDMVRGLAMEETGTWMTEFLT